MSDSDYHILPYGDRALLVQFPPRIDEVTNRRVHDLRRDLEQQTILGFQYAVPAYCSLMVAYNPLITSFLTLKKTVADRLKSRFSVDEKKTKTRRHHRVPVCYETAYAPDLAALCAAKNLSPDAFIEHHTNETFRVYMLGFLPGFAFMGRLPAVLRCDRKTTPRLRVPVGSVGLAGEQTGIYPFESPGGWQLIGRTPQAVFDPQNAEPFLFRPGDTVQFYAISAEHFSTWTAA